MTRSFWIGVGIAALIITTQPNEASAQSCRTLRQACLMKDSLGEQGRGNCRLYRERCGGGDPRENRCEQLRRACMFKEERGQTGEGNCRRYREACGG